MLHLVRLAALAVLAVTGLGAGAGPSAPYVELTTRRTAEHVLARMTLRQEVGQLFVGPRWTGPRGAC